MSSYLPVPAYLLYSMQHTLPALQDVTGPGVQLNASQPKSGRRKDCAAPSSMATGYPSRLRVYKAVGEYALSLKCQAPPRSLPPLLRHGLARYRCLGKRLLSAPLPHFPPRDRQQLYLTGEPLGIFCCLLSFLLTLHVHNFTVLCLWISYHTWGMLNFGSYKINASKFVEVFSHFFFKQNTFFCFFCLES
jgi:hypothetical protein